MVQQINPPPATTRSSADAPRFEPEPATWTSRIYWAIVFLGLVAFCVVYFLISAASLMIVRKETVLKMPVEGIFDVVV